MIRRTTINFLKRVISYLESTLVEKPKPFNLSQSDQCLIDDFLNSPEFLEDMPLADQDGIH